MRAREKRQRRQARRVRSKARARALYERLMAGVLANVGVSSSGYWRTTSVLQDHPPAIQARIDELLAEIAEAQDRMSKVSLRWGLTSAR